MAGASQRKRSRRPNAFVRLPATQQSQGAPSSAPSFRSLSNAARSPARVSNSRSRSAPSKASLPHPFPYQGSKRAIAERILQYFPSDVEALIEPFCGSAAVSIAAAAGGLARRFVICDLNEPLMALWKRILEAPEELADDYAKLWSAQQQDQRRFFLEIRSEFNRSHQPHHLLHLLARIVKGAVRYNASGMFNQSPDNRRLGMKPEAMRKNLLEVSHLLADKTRMLSTDFAGATQEATEKDLIYMDPPYQGTSSARDRRYLDSPGSERLISALRELNDRKISYILSYDGMTGDKCHGKPLPESLSLERHLIHAGRSSQATLLGLADETVESLYLSPALVQRLHAERNT